MARRARCKTDRDLVMLDHGNGYVEAVLELADDSPIVIAYATMLRRGCWIIQAGDGAEGASDPVDTKPAATDQLDILAARVRVDEEAAERHWRQTYPKTHEATKRQQAS
ncbi:hypothetical protein [Mycobacteroides abscessus]|uniref:hypothetical protein n=1 Tax=Mycobacteroides abscessus TaxID=36809 RepID=UPI0011C36459|nr:hypothetical protein [Mycobacteroides abscessus]